jgi:hypothetical protein
MTSGHPPNRRLLAARSPARRDRVTAAVSRGRRPRRLRGGPVRPVRPIRTVRRVRGVRLVRHRVTSGSRVTISQSSVELRFDRFTILTRRLPCHVNFHGQGRFRAASVIA